MQIFEEELQFSDLLSDAKSSISFDVVLKNISSEKLGKIENLPLGIANFVQAHMVQAGKKDSDLFYVPTILVTTGCNLNDDIFDPEETWNARKTPEDKPFNLEHNEKEIIGHITDNFVVDDDFNVIADDTTIDKLPGKFHIVTPSVIYAHWRDPELKERSEKMIEEINDGLWCVSMEALFTDFGYMLLDDDNKPLNTVARTKETAYLTKYLRAYGGSGKYDNHKIGRILKNITFSGKGLVKKPANPESIILIGDAKNTEITSVGVLSDSINDYHKNVNIDPKMENKTMASDNTEFQKEVAELKAKVDFITRERDEAKAKAAEAAEQLVKDKLTSLEANIKARDESIAEFKSKLDLSEKSLVEANKAKDEVVASLDKSTKELSEVKAEQIKIARISALEKIGFDAKSAEEKYTKFIGLSDEMFKEVVDSLAAMSPKDEEKMKKKMKDEEADANSKKIDAEGVLDSAKASSDINPVGDDGSEKNQEVVASLSSFFLGVSKRSRGKKNSTATTTVDSEE